MKKVTIKEMQNISTKKTINENEMQKTIGGRRFWGWDPSGDETDYDGDQRMCFTYCVFWICGSARSARPC